MLQSFEHEVACQVRLSLGLAYGEMIVDDTEQGGCEAEDTRQDGPDHFFTASTPRPNRTAIAITIKTPLGSAVQILWTR